LLPAVSSLIVTFPPHPSLNSRVYGGCSIAATRYLRSSKTIISLSLLNHLFSAVLGVFDCHYKITFQNRIQTTSVD
jgi:hypothetical protein